MHLILSDFFCYAVNSNFCLLKSYEMTSCDKTQNLSTSVSWVAMPPIPIITGKVFVNCKVQTEHILLVWSFISNLNYHD